MMHKRLLLLVTDLLIGGTPSVVRELAIRLKRHGVDVEVACLGHWGPTADQIAEGGVSVSALGAKGPYDLTAVDRLRRLVAAGRFDVVLSFLVHANVAATLALLGRRGVDLYQSIQTTQPKPRWHWWAQAAVSPAAARIVVPSQSVAEAARHRSMVSPERLVVIPNAVDAETFSHIQRVPARAGEVRIGFLGRLDPVKRVGDVLEAMAELPTAYRLLIYGTGREEPAIRRHVARLRLEQRVEMRGAVNRPQVALAEMDLLVLPSDAEGFGLVLIEAMAAGVPVIGTDVPGIRDVIQSGENGLLVPPRRPDKLADAILRLSTSAEMRDRLVATGKSTVLSRFAWETIVASYRELLVI